MQQQQIKTALVWFRNNLRVNDNISLKKAVDENQHIIAVYFFDPKYFERDNFGFKKTEKFRAPGLKCRIVQLDFSSTSKCNLFAPFTSLDFALFSFSL